MRCALALLFLFCLSTLTPTLVAAQATTRPAVPDPIAIQTATRLVDGVFADEIVKAKTPDAKAALAEKLLKAAGETTDNPASRYVLLRKTVDVAVGAGDAAKSLAAINELAINWDIDGLKLEQETLGRLVSAVRTPEAQADFARQADVVAGQAFAADRYDVAAQLLEMASNAASRANDPSLSRMLIVRRGAISEGRAAFLKMAPALDALASNPNDAEANLVVGRYQCFIKDNWEGGLPRLSHSAGKFHDIAVKDATSATDAADQMGLADAWWDLAEQESAFIRRVIRNHAAAWYRLSQAGLSGLAKVKCDKRLGDIEAEGPWDSWAGNGDQNGRPGHPVVRVKVAKANAREAQQVIDDVAAHFPTVLKDVRQLELLRYHDASEFKTTGNGHPQKLPGSFSATPMGGSDSFILFWGIYEKWGSGNYLFVYRVEALTGPRKTDVCFLDVCKDGNTQAQRRPNASDFDPGHWRAMPVSITLTQPTTLEYRLWPNADSIALDRLYIFSTSQTIGK